MVRAEIVSLNIGQPKPAAFNGKEVSTGLFKTPADEPLFLSRTNFEGDGQGDLVHHGGPDKAVCVYPHEHYPYWERELQRSLEYGAFGENLTIRGLAETDVCIGDIYRLGEASVQVSQPRQPCFKLSMRYGKPEMPLLVQETGFTGFYFRVLEEGLVSPADGLTRTWRHPLGVTVDYANRIMHRDKGNFEGIRRLLAVEELSANWRRTFEKRLGGGETDTRERLTGQG